jgi:hypothetical protein
MLSNDFVYSLDIRFPGFGVSGIVIAKRAVRAGCYPARETTASAFRIDVGSGAIEDIQAELFAGLKKTADVMGTRFKVNNAITWSVETPMYDKLPDLF